MSLTRFFLVAVLLCGGARAYSQVVPTAPDTTRTWAIETLDGNEFIGKIKSIEQGLVTFTTQSLGEIKIRAENIRRVTEVDPSKLKGSEYWYDNFQSTRYFWAPNGYGLKSGEAYYQNVWVLFNQASVGIGDHFSVGAGTIAPFVFGLGGFPFWVTPKVSFPLGKKVSAGVGVIYANFVSKDSNGIRDGIGIAYGVTTFGNRDANITIGVGYGFAGSRWASHPAVTISGMKRLSVKNYLLMENYILSTGSSSVVLSVLGGRHLFKRVGLDYGGVIAVGSDASFVPIPWLGLTAPIGKVARGY